MTQVLIGIPTLNGPDRLTRCLDSIRECTDLDGAEVLVSDDFSTPENLKLNKDAVTRFGCEMLVGESRRGIAANWNRLSRHTEPEVVVLLNDDVEVVKDWLEVLVYSVTANPHAGMVGLNCYTGVTKRQVSDALPVLQLMKRDFQEARLTDGGGTLIASHGYCFGFRREAFDDVEGFDERFFVYYEEIDFGCRLREKGYSNYMADYPTIFHMGGATNSNPMNLDSQVQLKESRRKFTEKWHGGTPKILREQFGKKGPVPAKCWNSQMTGWVI